MSSLDRGMSSRSDPLCPDGAPLAVRPMRQCTPFIEPPEDLGGTQEAPRPGEAGGGTGRNVEGGLRARRGKCLRKVGRFAERVGRLQRAQSLSQSS